MAKQGTASFVRRSRKSLIPTAESSPLQRTSSPLSHLLPPARSARKSILAGTWRILARILRDILGRFYFGLENPDFSYSIRNAPVVSAGVNYYHWCLNIVPNLPIPGLEKEGKMFLNPVLPEEAAQFLREVRIEQAIPA